MSTNFFRYIFLAVLLSTSLLSQAGIPSVCESSEATFDEKKIKKGIYLSEVFSQASKGKKDIKLKHSAAMRFDASYAPKDGGKPIDLPIDTIQKYVKRAHAVFKEVKDNQAFTTLLQGKNIKLPLGIKKQVGNKEIIICLDSLIFTPSYAYAVMFVIIEDTKNKKTLAFWGKDIRFTKDGGFTGDARLELLETYDLEFGQKSKISFLVDKTHENYVVFNCDGFKHLHVDAKVFFSRSTIIPETSPGVAAPDPAQVTAEFETDFISFDEWMVQISNVPKFQVAGLDGWTFEVGSLAFDYSSFENPSSIVFPAGYNHPTFIDSEVSTLWEGFYMRTLSVTLPEEFKLKSNTSKRITISVNNAIIDKMGFTGVASIQNLIPMSEGDMSGWAYSLDVITVDILKSSFRKAEFSGQLNIPITKETENFAYNALIQTEHRYSLTVTTKSTMSFPMWGAGKVTITPNSWVRIALVEKKFRPDASLNGTLSIGAGINKEGESETSNDNNKLSLLDIGFEKLRISSVKPYIFLDPNGGAFGVGSRDNKQKAAKFPITLNFIYLKTRYADQVGINLDVSLNILGSKDAGKGSGIGVEFTVWAKEKGDATLRYKFYKVELNCIYLKNVEIAMLKLDGSLCFFRDDVIYGSGFSGSVKFNIDLGSKNLELQAACIFGKKESVSETEGIFRYFALDVMMSSPVPIPVFPGILYMNAFGGGASMRMKVDETIKSPYFVSLSGMAYAPDENTGLGVKALLGVQGQTREAYEGQLIFEIVFNKDGGLKMIAFSGYVQVASFGQASPAAGVKSKMGGFIAKVKGGGASSSIYETDNPSQADVNSEIKRMADGGAVMAQWKMILDRDNKCFTANIDIFVDLFGIIKGVNANAHAGRIDILFQGQTALKKSEWHVFVGIPQRTIGVNVVGLVDITAYLMVGHNLYPPLRMPFPDAPYPSFPAGTNGAASDGKGFGVGARLKIDIGNRDGTFYFYAGVEAGFDVVFWNVKGQICYGKPKGVKNWYGAGQAFIYLYGGAGLKTCVNVPYPCHCKACHSCSKKCWRPWCWGCDWCHHKVCVDVGAKIDFGIYCIVEAVNPTYIEGGFRILGLPVKVKIGKRC